MIPKKKSVAFRFQQFAIEQDQCAMKVGTDGILLGAWAPLSDSKRILDIGAGTGLIGLMLAQRNKEATVVLVEIDEDSAQQAGDNAEKSPFGKRIKVVRSPIQDFALVQEAPFDLIVSNPPFFTGGVLSEQQDRASVRHTVKLSHQDLLRSVQRLLAPAGSFCVVLPWLEGLRFLELAATYQLYPQRIAKVSPNPEKPPNRILMELKKNARLDVEEETFSIYEAAGQGANRHPVFQELTKDFYLR